MTRPFGTHLQLRSQDRLHHQAQTSRHEVAEGTARRQAEFQRALDRLSERDLQRWQRTMRDLAHKISKNELIARDDRVRREVGAVLKQVRVVLEKAKDLQQWQAELKAPATPVLRAPAHLGTGGAELALVIGLVKVLEVLVRLRRRRSG